MSSGYENDGYEVQRRAEETFRALSRFSNGGTQAEKAAFVKEFLGEHNTLQQAQIGLFLHCMYALAEAADKGAGYIDLRNAAAAEAAKKVRDVLGPFGYALPLI